MSNHRNHDNHDLESPKGELLVYQTKDGRVRLDVRLEDETVWLTQQMLAKLFQTTVPNINMHISNIYEEGELDFKATIKEILTVRQEGTRQLEETAKTLPFAKKKKAGKMAKYK